MSRPDALPANAARRERTRLPPGTVVDGRYQITGHLGDGGFATVYRANDTVEHRQVALKILLASEFAIGDFDFGEFEMRFIREARATATLDHPNLATIYGSGFAQDKLYIAMELFDGLGLGDALQAHGPFDPARAMALMLPALEALGRAHDARVVHRDLKPSNLFLAHPHTPEERLVILDFGVARIEDTDLLGKLTNPGQVLGTPSYTAPEALKADITVPACDVYSMALILLEMLTGRRVVHADSIYATMAMHVSGDFRVPGDLFEGPLGPILNRALAPDPEDRFRNGQAFFTALKTVAQHRIRLDPGAETIALATLRDSGRIPPMPAQLVALLTAGSNPAVRSAADTSNPAVRTPPTAPQPAAPPGYASGYASGHIHLGAMSAAMPLDALHQQQAQQTQGSLGTVIVVIVAIVAALAVLGAVVWFGFVTR